LETLLNNAWFVLGVHFLLATSSAGHALLYKRDPRAALGWIAVSLAYPIIGPLLYYLFGINRLRTRAHQMKGEPMRHLKIGYEGPEIIGPMDSDMRLPEVISDPGMAALARSSAAVTHRALVANNNVEAFFSGEEAYAAMLQAIEDARISVTLATYIFESDRTGRRFIDALSAAKRRGVDVRILLDGVGEWYSLPRAGSLLRAQGVRVARFVPPRILPPSIHINLRNHRKLLIVDGLLGFTGGMNIGDRHLHQQPAHRRQTADIHFQLEGPIVEQLRAVFDEDWSFAAGDKRDFEYGVPRDSGTAVCRVVTDGPNEDLGKLAMTITGAVSLAQKRVSIMTPYFLPPRELITTLQAAALRGVEVCVVLPGISNQPLAQWATRNMLWELLQYGVRVFYQPPPFAHSKLMMIDDSYAHIGSANLDPRSLRLNFEIVVEVFDKQFVAVLQEHFDRIRAGSREETLSSIDKRRLPAKIRDAICWLFSPYL